MALINCNLSCCVIMDLIKSILLFCWMKIVKGKEVVSCDFERIALPL